MHKLRLAILITLFATVTTVLATLPIPPPPTWQGSSLAFHMHLAIAMFVPALHVLAALFFLQGLAGFKEEFRSAYRRIAAGIVGVGFSLLASPLVTFFDLWDLWPVQLGAIIPPYLLALAVMFAGIRVFYQKLQFPTRWRSLKFNAAVLTGGLVFVVIMPHAASPVSEVVYDVGNFMFAFATLALLIAAANALAVQRYVAPNYAKVLGWLGAGLIVEASLVGTSIILKAFGIDLRHAAGGLQDFLVVSAVPFIVSGRLFYQLTADTREAVVQTGATPVDVILYVSSLASSQQAIDPILDELRIMTAQREPGTPLSVDEQTQLANIYLRLEQHLTQNESVRSFTTAQLRQHIYHEFNATTIPAYSTFWAKIPTQRTEAPQPTLPSMPAVAHP